MLQWLTSPPPRRNGGRFEPGDISIDLINERIEKLARRHLARRASQRVRTNSTDRKLTAPRSRPDACSTRGIIGGVLVVASVILPTGFVGASGDGFKNFRKFRQHLIVAHFTILIYALREMAEQPH